MDPTTTTIDAAAPDAAAARLLRSADACRVLELERLTILAELIKDLGGLVHSLQKERGVSSIFLGSSAGQFGERLGSQREESRHLERRVCEHLELIDGELERMNPGARFYVRAAVALRSLGTLAAVRRQIATLVAAPQDAIKDFTDIIGALLAVSFEAANVAADPATSRMLIALVSFAQGKEYAGQERATAGAALSRGRLERAELERLERLEAAQERAFQIFAGFAADPHVSSFRESMGREGRSSQLALMRAAIHRQSPDEETPPVAADDWYQLTTWRIDEMRAMEERLASDLQRLCREKLLEAHSATASVSAATADQIGVEGGIGFFSLDGALPKPLRSILEVIDAQSRHIDDISAQLESARLALAERKSIERAKGLLMRSRRLSENDAYALMRQTAMKQNKRLYEVAEAILSMAELLR